MTIGRLKLATALSLLLLPGCGDVLVQTRQSVRISVSDLNGARLAGATVGYSPLWEDERKPADHRAIIVSEVQTNASGQATLCWKQMEIYGGLIPGVLPNRVLDRIRGYPDIVTGKTVVIWVNGDGKAELITARMTPRHMAVGEAYCVVVGSITKRRRSR